MGDLARRLGTRATTAPASAPRSIPPGERSLVPTPGELCAMAAAMDCAHRARAFWALLGIGLGICGLSSGCARLHAFVRDRPKPPSRVARLGDAGRGQPG